MRNAMNLLLIDDQISVINGIEKGIRFRELNIDRVFTASSAAQARNILMSNEIHIMLCDIEMPEENGLQLNQWVMETMPDVIRILLTSHADFEYARESLRLGCFDYIVQPAPYDEIEDCLRRAVHRLESERRKNTLCYYGMIYEKHKPEMSDRIVNNLFSENRENVNQSLLVLEQMGYHLDDYSRIRILILDIFSYSKATESVLYDISIRHSLLDSLCSGKIVEPVEALIALNRSRQFVILLFCDDDSLLSCKNADFQMFYEVVGQSLDTEMACYVGKCSLFSELRSEVKRIHRYIDNNVSKKPGLYMTDEKHFFQDSLDISENIKRWQRLLKDNQLEKTRDSILSWLDFIVSVNRTNFSVLCELHQQLIQLFFNCAWDNQIDIADLFTDDYGYNDCMDAFRDVESLRFMVCHITGAIQSAEGCAPSKDDIQKAKIYILDHISNNLSVREVADHVHLSPEYFTKLFKKETGQNIKNYIMQQKVDAAKDLLDHSEIPVSLVALELGYTNFSHFTQMFKKFENMTPSEYRKRKSEG